MSISKINKPVTLKAVAVCLLVTALGVPLETAGAQMRQEEPDAMDVARTPLEDFNIDSKDIPEVLVAAVNDPYDLTGIVSCNHLSAQIAVLDNILGPDFDIPREENSGVNVSTGRVAKSVVGSIIPFRGIVREVSGANKKRSETRLAYTAGMVRRGYLKGMGQERDCTYPARPRQAVGEVDASLSYQVPPNIVRGQPEDADQDLVPVGDPNGQ